MNNGLYRLHRVIFIGYAVFAVLAAFVGIVQGGESLGFSLVGIGLLPIGALHYYAAKGAKEGKAWGRTTSRIIAAVMLFGVPIGTITGIYIFTKTGKNSQSATV